MALPTYGYVSFPMISSPAWTKMVLALRVKSRGLVTLLRKVNLPLITRLLSTGVEISSNMLAPGIISTSSPSTGTLPDGQVAGTLQSYVSLLMGTTITEGVQLNMHLMPKMVR